MNIESEIESLIEALDDARDQAFEEWSMSFTDRQYGDFVNANGATHSTSWMFSAIERNILDEALDRIKRRINEANDCITNLRNKQRGE
jgi:hypothetical protein